MKKQLRKIEREVEVYIADDGKMFYSKSECEKHESDFKRKAVIGKANQLRITELDGVIPLDTEGGTGNERCWTWFKLESIEDWFALEDTFRTRIYGDYPEKFPCIVCIEAEFEEYGDCPYVYSLDEMLVETKGFWHRFGYEVELKKVEE